MLVPFYAPFQAAAANRRLKEALAKQKKVLEERNQKFEKYDNTSVGNRIKVMGGFRDIYDMILVANTVVVLKAYATSKGSDQTAHPPSLIRAFGVGTCHV